MEQAELESGSMIGIPPADSDNDDLTLAGIDRGREGATNVPNDITMRLPIHAPLPTPSHTNMSLPGSIQTSEVPQFLVSLYPSVTEHESVVRCLSGRHHLHDDDDDDDDDDPQDDDDGGKAGEVRE